MIDDRIRRCPNCETDFDVRAVVVSATCRRYQCRKCGRSWSQGSEPRPNPLFITGTVPRQIGQAAPTVPSRVQNTDGPGQRHRFLGLTRWRPTDKDEAA
jgi:hypothetical protein